MQHSGDQGCRAEGKRKITMIPTAASEITASVSRGE
jgi:hypothetical protein